MGKARGQQHAHFVPRGVPRAALRPSPGPAGTWGRAHRWGTAVPAPRGHRLCNNLQGFCGAAPRWFGCGMGSGVRTLEGSFGAGPVASCVAARRCRSCCRLCSLLPWASPGQAALPTGALRRVVRGKRSANKTRRRGMLCVVPAVVRSVSHWVFADKGAHPACHRCSRFPVPLYPPLVLPGSPGELRGLQTCRRT